MPATSEMPGAASDRPLVQPFFLVGSVRSGTTLLGLMLDHHPEIAFPGEFELSVDMLGEDGTTPDLASYHDWLSTDRHFRWHGLQIDPALDYRALVQSFLVQMRDATGSNKRQVGVAVHRRIHLLPTLWPRSRFIHLVRDGRDVASSIIEHGWAGNSYTAAERWRLAEEEWDRCCTRLDDSQRFEVRFEDLVKDPKSVLEPLCAFLGKQYDDRMLSYPDDTTYSRVDPGQAQKWRRKLSSGSVKLSELGAGDMLEKRAYEARYVLTPPARVHRGLLRLHCRVATLAFRIRRYGLTLWIARRLATALHIRSWRKRIQLRENEITNRHVK